MLISEIRSFFGEYFSSNLLKLKELLLPTKSKITIKIFYY